MKVEKQKGRKEETLTLGLFVAFLVRRMDYDVYRGALVRGAVQFRRTHTQHRSDHYLILVITVVFILRFFFCDADAAEGQQVCGSGRVSGGD